MVLGKGQAESDGVPGHASAETLIIGSRALQLREAEQVAEESKQSLMATKDSLGDEITLLKERLTALGNVDLLFQVRSLTAGLECSSALRGLRRPCPCTAKMTIITSGAGKRVAVNQGSLVRARKSAAREPQPQGENKQRVPMIGTIVCLSGCLSILSVDEHF